MADLPQSNTLGKASLVLAILGSTLVFCSGLCAGVGQQQGWLKAAATPLFLVGATAAFLAFLAVFLGFAGLFGRNRSRAAAVAGFLLGLGTLFLFALILRHAKP